MARDTPLLTWFPLLVVLPGGDTTRISNSRVLSCKAALITSPIDVLYHYLQGFVNGRIQSYAEYVSSLDLHNISSCHQVCGHDELLRGRERRGSHPMPGARRKLPVLYEESQTLPTDEVEHYQCTKRVVHAGVEDCAYCR